MASAGAIRAGKGEVEIGANLSQLEMDLNAAKATLQAWGTSVAKAGAIIGAIGGAIASPFVYGLSQLTGMADEFSDVARQTGLPVGRVIELMAGLRMSGEDTAKLFRKMSSFMEDAARGSGSTAQTMDSLNLSFAELNSLNPEDRLMRISDALGEVAQRDFSAASQLGRTIFGDRADVSRLLAGSGAIRARSDRAREIGSMISPEEVAAAKEYTAAQKELGAVGKAIWAGLGAVAAPVLAELMRLALPVLTWIRKTIVEFRPLLSAWFKFGMVLIGIGSAIAAVGGAIFSVGTILGGIALAIPLIIAGLKIFGVIVAGVLGTALMLFAWVVVPAFLLYQLVTMLVDKFPSLGDSIQFASNAARNYFSAWLPILQNFANGFTEIWGGILDSVRAGDLAMAFSIATLGMMLLWAQWINYARESWLAFRFMFTGTFPNMSDTIRGFIVGFMNAFYGATAYVVNVFVDMINELIDALPAWIVEDVGLQRLDQHVVDRAAIERVANRFLPAGGARQAGNEFQDEVQRARAEEAGLQGRIDAANMEAWFAAQVAAVNREMALAEVANAGEGFQGQTRHSAFGTFSADQAMSYFGSDSPTQRLERIQLRQAEQMEMMRRLLQDIRDRGAIQFG
jgi:hypothetical protein